MTLAAQETVLALFGAFAARDAEAAIAVAHPEIELWAQPTGEQIGRREPYRGHDGLREYFADVDRAWESFEVDPGDFRVAGGGVIAFGSAMGVAHGESEARRVGVIWVFRLRDGLIAFCRAARTAEEATRLAAGGTPSDHQETP